MTDAAPMGAPKGDGPLAKREARLAFALLAPTFAIVALIVAAPLLANFWISAKPVGLADLRPAEATVSERARGEALAIGEESRVTYTVRNSSPNLAVDGAGFTDPIPDGFEARFGDDAPCVIAAGALECEIGTIAPGERIRFDVAMIATAAVADAERALEGSEPATRGAGENPLTNLSFTAENFRKVFDAAEFWTVLWTSIVYAIFGTGGALALGLFAALLLDKAFRGRALLRGLFLFPYVAPVIACAYTWVALLDPNSGALNAILLETGAVTAPVNFLGQRTAFEMNLFGFTVDFPMALTTVIVFEAWRYFPLAFLFILARMQSIGTDMYEAAEIDGATPLQQFWALSLPQLATILAILFLLRFIWTFNKFDDVFLLTGGAAGTRTLTVNVYEQAIGLSNIGAGAAVAVVVFVVLLAFSLVFFRFSPKEDG